MSGTTNFIGIVSATTNTASTLVARDSSGNFSAGTITSTLLNVNGGGGTTTSLAIGASASGLTGTSYAQTFSNNFSAGNYLNIGTHGRNIGVVTGGNHFISWGLDYNSTTPGYQYNNAGSQAGASLELTSSGGFNFNTAPVGTSGSAATMTTRASISNTGVVNIPELTVSSLVVTDGSSNLSSTNTLSSTVLGNITKVTTTTLSSGSGTYTAPTNCTHVRMQMWGAGGGGGGVAGAAGSGGAAGGGASGSYVETIITSPTSYSYSVGTGGAGGAAGNNNGSSGGSSTFGSFTAGGGTGGIGYTAGLGAGTALGGTPTGNGGSPTISFIGNPGLHGTTISTTVAISGAGASAPYGGGAASPVHTSGSGAAGSVPGAGGSGGISTNGTSFTGGAGAAGFIRVEEYYNG